MAQHTLNTRIQLKYDSYENWKNNNPTLLAGEIAIVTLSTDENISKVSESDKIQNPPTVLFKVGPGEFNSLKWASALAADVHDWAKLSYIEFLALLQETFYTETEVNNLIAAAEGRAATDAKNKADAAEANAKAYTDQEVLKITTGAGYATTKYVDDAVEVEKLRAEGAESQLSGRIATLEAINHDAYIAADAALKTELQGYADGKANTAESNAKSYADGLLVEAKGYSDGNLATAKSYADSVAGTAKSEAISAAKQETESQISAVVSQYLTGEGAEETIDTLQEIVTWLNTEGAGAEKIVADVAQNAKDIDDLAKDTYRKSEVYTKSEADAAFMDATETENAINAKITELDLANTYQAKGNYQPAGNYKTVQNAVAVKGAADKTLKVSQDTNGVIATEEVAIQIAESQVTGLTDRINAKANDVDLAAIAKTGNVNDLVQTAGDVLIFNCGSSSTVL